MISRNNRGVSLVLEAFIGFILAGLAMVFIFYVSARLGHLFLAPSIDPATKANMETLAQTIHGLAAKEKGVIRHFPFHIGKDYILIGFPKSNTVVDECYAGLAFRGQQQIPRPRECSSTACLCLYKNDIGTDDFGQKQPLLPCILFPEIAVFYSTYHKDEEQQQAISFLPSKVWGNIVAAPLRPQPKAYGDWTGDYQYFIVYGDGCKAGSGTFGVQELYLDAHLEDTGVYIFIAGESKNTNDRFYDLQESSSGFRHTLSKQFSELIALAQKDSVTYETLDAVFTLLSMQGYWQKIQEIYSPEKIKHILFKRYEKSSNPSVTEEVIRKNAALVWAKHSKALIALGYPGEVYYIRACVSAFAGTKTDNDCWIPKYMDLNR